MMVRCSLLRTVLQFSRCMSTKLETSLCVQPFKRGIFGVRHFCTVSEGVIIFDRGAKRVQRNRAASLDEYDVCQYVKV